MLKISIVQGHHEAQSRQTKSGTRYFQSGYAHIGGAFPSAIEISLRSPADAYAVGEYEISLKNYQVGKYKNLELNPFEMFLVPVLSQKFSKTA